MHRPISSPRLLPGTGSRSPRRARTLVGLAALLMLGALVAAPALAQRDARRFMPQPLPPPAASGPTTFLCDTPVDAPASVRMAYQEYYACATPILDGWLAEHADALDSLEVLYAQWLEGRRHDLRDQPAAAQWTRRHRVDFTPEEVQLTARQMERMGPDRQGVPVQVPGILQRLFVDRASERLFLTSSSEGLLSIDISQRYAFRYEGAVGSSGATDFFIVDGRTAYVEETSEEGGNRDLVVLDISDRSAPREIYRLHGILPASGGSTTFRTAMAKHRPTFAQYRLVREGLMGTQGCGAPPTVSTHPGVRCRPDGSCFRRESFAEAPEGAFCERVVAAPRPVPMARPGRPMPRPEPGVFEDEVVTRPMPRRAAGAVDLDSAGVGMGRGAGGAGSAPRSLEASSGAPAPTPMPSAAPAQRAPVADARAEAPRSRSAAEEAAPAGGAGGAGSLSQMMVVGSTLYVLSADHGIAEGWLTSFDISRPQRPTVAHVIRLDNGPEALQRHDSLLLIAGRDALVTASVAIANAPRLLGEYRQVCPVNFDPVVVQGSVAYRTIIVDQPRSMCSSRMEIIELSQPHQPMVRSQIPLQRPRGMAVLGERLFLADEREGVHFFDITDGVNPRLVATWAQRGVMDLVISGFDLYALSPDRVVTRYLGPLYGPHRNLQQAADQVDAITTVVSGPWRDR